MDENQNIENQEETTLSNDELKSAIEGTLSKIRRQSMLLGAQTMCKAILDKITVFERSQGNKSNNDHKRLIKDIKKFCEVGLSRKINQDGEAETAEETVQN